MYVLLSSKRIWMESVTFWANNFHIYDQITGRRTGGVKQFSWANYLFQGLGDKPGPVSWRDASTNAENQVENLRIGELVYHQIKWRHFQAGYALWKFPPLGQNSNLRQGLMASFLMLWLKRCVVPTLPHEAIVVDVARVELPYTYMVAWYVMHCPSLMLAIQAPEDFVPFVQKLKRLSLQGCYMAVIQRMIQSSVNYQLVRCSQIFQERPTGSDLSTILVLMGSPCFQLVYAAGWSTSDRGTWLSARECVAIEPYMPSWFTR